LSLLIAAAVGGGILAWWFLSPSAPAGAPRSGGELVATIRSEPRSLNRFVARDVTSHVVSLLTHARLVRLNLATQEVEPALAERWDRSPDGRTYTFHLRSGVTFSDGATFTARDVAFSFRALFDPKVGSPISSSVLVGGAAPVVSVTDDQTVSVTFPSAFAPALRVLDWVPVLPAHKLAAALDAGTFRDQWTVTTPPSEIAGLGPFVLREYTPGQRLVFERNPRYWARDVAGQPLPRLDRLTLLVVPDQNAEMLRLESGEADLVSGAARPEDVAALRRAEAAGRLRLTDVGVGLDPDFFWFNLRPAVASDPARAWLTAPALREAVSLAVDRQAFADVVYLGNAVVVDSPITPGHAGWYDASRPLTPHDPDRAAGVLQSAGVIDRDGDGVRDTPAGRPARFTVATQKGNAIRERAAAFLQEQLAAVGLVADMVPLETGALVERLSSGNYDAAFFGAVSSDVDPGTHLDFWLSSGSFHVWNPGQPSPATEWEARIDGLMQRMVAATEPRERVALFRDVQRAFGGARPALYFAAPKVLIATSSRVGHVRPALLQPSVLWDAERLTVVSGDAGAR
jgi:peptide/nickel transport system substrate-binding protein